MRRLELAAHGYTQGPRFGEKCREQLVRCRKTRASEILDMGNAVRTLERRVKRNLSIILVEQILRPEFDRPLLLRTANADTGIDRGAYPQARTYAVGVDIKL